MTDKKLAYEKAVASVMYFDNSDVITTSVVSCNTFDSLTVVTGCNTFGSVYGYCYNGLQNSPN